MSLSKWYIACSSATLVFVVSCLMAVPAAAAPAADGQSVVSAAAQTPTSGDELVSRSALVSIVAGLVGVAFIIAGIKLSLVAGEYREADKRSTGDNEPIPSLASATRNPDSNDSKAYPSR